jgi:hypothetical protein
MIMGSEEDMWKEQRWKAGEGRMEGERTEVRGKKKGDKSVIHLP